MTDDTPPSEPEPQPHPAPRATWSAPKHAATISPARLLAIVRFLAEETERVIFGDHAQCRMDERGITDTDVFAVLRTGEAKGAILPGDQQGEWKVKVVAKPRGSRQIGVVTIVVMDSSLFIKTVEWEDR